MSERAIFRYLGVGKRKMFAEIVKEAGDLWGQDVEERARSYLDAGYHIGYDWEEVKRVVAQHFRSQGFAKIAKLVEKAFISDWGVAWREDD